MWDYREYGPYKQNECGWISFAVQCKKMSSLNCILSWIWNLMLHNLTDSQLCSSMSTLCAAGITFRTFKKNKYLVCCWLLHSNLVLIWQLELRIQCAFLFSNLHFVCYWGILIQLFLAFFKNCTGYVALLVDRGSHFVPEVIFLLFFFFFAAIVFFMLMFLNQYELVWLVSESKQLTSAHSSYL